VKKIGTTEDNGFIVELAKEEYEGLRELAEVFGDDLPFYKGVWPGEEKVEIRHWLQSVKAITTIIANLDQIINVTNDLKAVIVREKYDAVEHD
jgi:hypothetical protein